MFIETTRKEKKKKQTTTFNKRKRKKTTKEKIPHLYQETKSDNIKTVKKKEELYEKKDIPINCHTIGLICSTTIVQAKSTTFYEGEYIDGIYMNKQKKGSSTIYYQKARFFRQSGTNRFAYCIDPFVFFEEGSIYEETITPSNLPPSKKKQSV